MIVFVFFFFSILRDSNAARASIGFFAISSYLFKPIIFDTFFVSDFFKLLFHNFSEFGDDFSIILIREIVLKFFGWVHIIKIHFFSGSIIIDELFLEKFFIDAMFFVFELFFLFLLVWDDLAKLHDKLVKCLSLVIHGKAD